MYSATCYKQADYDGPSAAFRWVLNRENRGGILTSILIVSRTQGRRCMEMSSYLLLFQPVLSALIGALVVYYFGIRRLGVERRSSFRERQLAEFYAPLAGIRKQIVAKSELRVKISKAAETAWQKICTSYGNRQPARKSQWENNRARKRDSCRGECTNRGWRGPLGWSTR